MIRRICRLGIGIFIFSLFLGNPAWSADPYGSVGGGYDQGQSPYQGTISPYPKSPEFGSPYQQGIGTPSPYLSPSMMAPVPGEPGGAREPSLAEKYAVPPLPPLPEEPQSAFEQLVSGKIEITRPQFEVIKKDPNIRFMTSMGVAPPGTILVPVKIIPGPEKKDSRAISPMALQVPPPPDLEAGYLVGNPDRISELFRLLGISSPYSISMDLKHFGMDLFLQGRTGFYTTNRLPVGPDYMLGPGDEVKVRVWGKVEGAWNLMIERDGTVRLPKVGVVTLGGLTFEQAKEVLQKELSRYYSGFEMNVTLGALRTMTVYVVGNARQPGAYTVSSLATLVNVLIQAGGTDQVGNDEGHPDPQGGEAGRALRYVRPSAAGRQDR